MQEVARFFRVTPKQVRRWIAAGRLVAFKTVPGRTGRLRVLREDVAQFVRARRHDGPENPRTDA